MRALLRVLGTIWRLLYVIKPFHTTANKVTSLFFSVDVLWTNWYVYLTGKNILSLHKAVYQIIGSFIERFLKTCLLEIPVPSSFFIAQDRRQNLCRRYRMITSESRQRLQNCSPMLPRFSKGAIPKIVEGSRCYCNKRFPKLLRQRLTLSKYCRSYSARGSLSLSKLLRQWSSRSVQRFLCQSLSNSPSLST